MNKKIVTIGITLVFLIVGLGGCLDLMPDIGGISDGYDEDFEWVESDFVGTWKLTYEGDDITECEFILKNNGHFTKNCIHEESIHNTAGRWFLRETTFDHQPITFISFRNEKNYASSQQDYRFEWINKDKVILDYDEWNFENPKPKEILTRV